MNDCKNALCAALAIVLGPNTNAASSKECDAQPSHQSANQEPPVPLGLPLLEVAPLLFSSVPHAPPQSDLDFSCPTDGAIIEENLWEPLPVADPIVSRIHSCLIKSAPRGLNILHIPAVYKESCGADLELPSSTGLWELLHKHPRLFEINPGIRKNQFHVNPLPYQ